TRGLNSHLVSAAAETATDIQARRILENHTQAGLARKLRAQSLDHVIGTDPLIQGLQSDKDRAAVAATIATAGADGRCVRLHVWILLNDVGNHVRMFNHVIERNALRAFRATQQQPGVAARNKTFRHDAEEIKREDRENQTDRDREKRMQQNLLQRPLIKLQDAVVDAFGESPP